VVSCVVPLVALTVIYLRIFCAARISSVNARKTSLAHRQLPPASTAMAGRRQASDASLGGYGLTYYYDEEYEEEEPTVNEKRRPPTTHGWVAEDAIREYCTRVARSFNQSRLSTIGSGSSTCANSPTEEEKRGSPGDNDVDDEVRLYDIRSTT